LLQHISGAGMVGIPLVEMVLFKHLDFAKCNRPTFHSCSWCLAAAVSTAVNAASCSFISDEAYLILAAYPRGSLIQCSAEIRLCPYA
jgi:hypothetical protein